MHWAGVIWAWGGALAHLSEQLLVFVLALPAVRRDLRLRLLLRRLQPARLLCARQIAGGGAGEVRPVPCECRKQNEISKPMGTTLACKVPSIEARALFCPVLTSSLTVTC